MSQPWFGWAVLVVVGLPATLVALTEWHGHLERTQSRFARPVALVRNVVVPLGAILVLVTQATEVSADLTWVRLVATAFGFLVLVVVLASLNVALFTNARQGTWRERIPSIFVDIARLVIIVVGLGLIFSLIWGADVGGLFAALGVTGIIIGLALQNAFGSVISGLLLLFEQPFELGDWITVGGIRGRVVEVNWRSVHIVTGSGIQVVPNSQLAGASFTNLSRPSVSFDESVELTFARNDPPVRVRALLEATAARLPTLAPGEIPAAHVLSSGKYEISLAVRTVSEISATRTMFLTWLWYAARREGLHLDGAPAPVPDPGEVAAAVAQAARSLALAPEELDALASVARVEVYGAGELIQVRGDVPDGLRVILRGLCHARVGSERSSWQVIGVLERGDLVGQSVVLDEPAPVDVAAVGETELLYLPTSVVNSRIRSNQAMARRIGEAIERRRAQVAAHLATAGGRAGGSVTDARRARSPRDVPTA